MGARGGNDGLRGGDEVRVRGVEALMEVSTPILIGTRVEERKTRRDGVAATEGAGKEIYYGIQSLQC